MIPRLQKVICGLLAASIPVAVFAFSRGAPIRRTGSPADGGLDCSACHRSLGPANSQPGGRVSIETGPYSPGTQQLVRVTVEHPEAQRWGFQLTARPVADPTRKAGTFEAITDQILVQCDPDSRPGPCGDNLEFATHTTNSTMPGENGRRVFEVRWTPPPGDEIGDIMLYAAGNAANNDRANTGDRIYTTSLRIRPEAACSLTTRPTVRTAANGASFGPQMALNTIVSIFGADFQLSGGRRQVNAGYIRDAKFPTELGCVAVEIGGQRAPVLYVQPDQINVQVPTLNLTGNVPLRVILNPGRPNELRSDVATISLQTYAPAFFTFNRTSIAALHLDNAPVADPAVVAGGRPVRPGDQIQLYATGLGVTEPVYQAGEIPATAVRLRDPVTVTVGGITLPASEIAYAGLSPTSISGLYQVNIRVPAAAPDGNLPVTLQIGGIASGAGITIPVRR